MLIQLSRIKQNRKIIGIFDRDSDEYISFTTDGSCPYKNLGNNVFTFAIPLVNKTEYGDKISIEHYYHKIDLLSKDCNDRRLFLGEEFFGSGNSKDGQYQTRISKLQNKIAVNGIIDEKVFRAVIWNRKNLSPAQKICSRRRYCDVMNILRTSVLTALEKSLMLFAR